MHFGSTAAHAILMRLAGWIHREHEAIVAYQKEEIRALRELLGGNGCASPMHNAVGSP